MSLKLKSHICSSHVKVLCFPILRGKKFLQEMVGWGGGGWCPLLSLLFPTTLSNVIGHMKKFSNFYRLSSESLPMFHKLSSMGVFAVEVIFLYFSPSSCAFSMSSNSQALLCISVLTRSIIALFRKFEQPSTKLGL